MEDKSDTPIIKPRDKTSCDRLSVGKKLLFTLIVVCVFFTMAECLLMLFGLRPVTYEKDPYVGFSSYSPLFKKQQTTPSNYPQWGRFSWKLVVLCYYTAE